MTASTDPADEFQQIMADYFQREQARLNEVKTRLRGEIMPRLKKWGVAKVEVEYSGYGDSGCIDGITYLDATGEPVNMALVQSASDPDIEHVSYAFLPSGFENNDGGQGMLTIEVETGKVLLAHSDNETITHETSEEWEV